MDIGCRMALMIIEESDSYLKRYPHQLKVALKECTHFGSHGLGASIAQHYTNLAMDTCRLPITFVASMSTLRLN
jgi:hypothetical protein